MCTLHSGHVFPLELLEMYRVIALAEKKKKARLLPSLAFSSFMPLRQDVYVFCADSFSVSLQFYNSCVFCFHLDLVSSLGRPHLVMYICLQQMICSRH